MHAATTEGGDRGRFELFVLGTAQDGGRPQVGCTQACCREARAAGRSAWPVALGIHDRAGGRLLLVEATPALGGQVALLHELAGVRERPRRPVDAILLTHAHIGHYLGLAQLGREVAAVRDLPVHVGPRMAAFLETNAPWEQLVRLGRIRLVRHDPNTRFEALPGLLVEAIPVPHRDEYSETYAYRFHGPRRTVLFVPDVDAWDRNPGLIERLLAGTDVAYVDGTFYDGTELPDRDLTKIPHPFVARTVELLAGFARTHPGAVRFVHLNHTNPLWRDKALRARLASLGFRIARRGERLEL